MIVTIWPPGRTWSKLLWLAVFVSLTFFEINNLYQERDKHDREQVEARETERKAFKSIADGITTSITNNQRAFDETMHRMERLSGLSKETIDLITGGDSFCYFTVAPNMGAGDPITYPLSVWVKGKYPMRHVVAEIQTVSLGKDPESLERQMRSMRTLPLGDGTLLPGVHPINARVPLGSYIITIWSATGLITQTMELKMVNRELDQLVDVWSKGKRLYASAKKPS